MGLITVILNPVIMMIDYKAIGRRISLYRKKKGLTQAVLSEMLGVSESYISQVERGSAKISLTRLDEISEVLSTDIVLLISDSVILSELSVNSEIFEIIKNWDKEKTDFLIRLLLCADNYFFRQDN